MHMYKFSVPATVNLYVLGESEETAVADAARWCLQKHKTFGKRELFRSDYTQGPIGEPHLVVILDDEMDENDIETALELCGEGGERD